MRHGCISILTLSRISEWPVGQLAAGGTAVGCFG